MLMLSRRIGERLVFYSDKGLKITLVVTSISTRRNAVVLGIEAPQDIHLDREEIYLSKLEDQLAEKGVASV